MALQECPATKYREGCCWKCKCGKTIAPRVGSILENSHVTYEEFIKILAYFAEGKSVTSAAQHGNLAKDTVRRFYNKKHQRIAEDIITQTNIGGPGTVVDIDESKFGKQKYFYGRMVEGAWILGGIQVQRGNNYCFLTPCPGNLRDEPTLLRLILQFVLPGTTIITDGWKSYINLNRHGYVHTDVNHSEDFVNPATAGHTNTIEGTWTHAKYQVVLPHLYSTLPILPAQ